MLPLTDPLLLSANPKFNALYSDLCNNKLNQDGTSRLDPKAQRDHDTISQDLSKARIEAVKRDLVTSGLQNLPYRADELPEELRQLVTNVTALLEGQIAAEDKYLLQDDLTKFQGNIKQICAALSRKYEQDALLLATMIEPDNPPSASNLNSSVSKLKDSISTSESTITHSRLSLAQEASKLHEIYRQVIEQSIRILEQTIHGSVARGAKAKADYLALVAEGMSKKVNLQNGLLISQLSSPAFQEVLQTKMGELQGENRSAKRKIKEVEGRLDEYNKIKGMSGLAQEYAEVLKETEKVKADIARLEKAKQ